VTVARIGFIGVGIMGSPMAANLVRAGHQVTGHDHKQSAMDRLAAAGGKGAPTVADAVRGAEVVVTMLPDSPHVEEVALGPFGIIKTIEAAGTSGVLHIDFSTIRPETSRELARAGGQVVAAARDADVSLPMTGLVAQLIAAARARGFGAEDHSALLRVIEGISGSHGV
jgi:2-hydroxy-3-oxopropionate reductase